MAPRLPPDEVLRAVSRAEEASQAVLAKHRGKMLDLLQRTNKELRGRLGTLPPDSFAAQSTRAVLIQTRAAAATFAKRLDKNLGALGLDSAGVGRDALIDQAAAWDRTFPGTFQRIARIEDAAELLDDVLLAHYESSARRYGVEGIARLQSALAEASLRGDTMSETTDSLVDAFSLTQGQAERIVRTEGSRSKHRQQLRDLTEMLPTEEHDEWRKQLVAVVPSDGRTAPDSISVHLQIRKLDDDFQDNEGRKYPHPPNRPNDRETMVLMPATPEQVAKEQAEAATVRPKLSKGQVGALEGLAAVDEGTFIAPPASARTMLALERKGLALSNDAGNWGATARGRDWLRTRRVRTARRVVTPAPPPYIPPISAPKPTPARLEKVVPKDLPLATVSNTARGKRYSASAADFEELVASRRSQWSSSKLAELDKIDALESAGSIAKGDADAFRLQVANTWGNKPDHKTVLGEVLDGPGGGRPGAAAWAKIIDPATRGAKSKALAREAHQTMSSLYSQRAWDALEIEKAGKVKVRSRKGRAFYRDSKREATVDSNKSARAREATIAHELGHWLEAQGNLSLHTSTREWRDFRTKGDPLRRLKDITGIRYPAREVTREDKFWDAYVGRNYGRRAGRFTEVYTMGVQEFVDSDGIKRLIERDPEHAGMILHLLLGKVK